jgi:hypothetical protein
MQIANDVFQITMAPGNKRVFSNFTNLQLFSALGQFKVSNTTFSFADTAVVPGGSSGGTLAEYVYISSDGTAPGGALNTAAATSLKGVQDQSIEVECITAGIICVTIEK